jgi:hypothetical protein
VTGGSETKTRSDARQPLPRAPLTNPISDPSLGSDPDNSAPNPLLGGPDLRPPGHVPPSMTEAGGAPLQDVQVGAWAAGQG